MKEKDEIEFLLARVEKIIKRIQVLKNPPEYYKMQNCDYKLLLNERDLYRFFLGYSGYDINGSYESIEKSLDELENEN